MKKYYTALMAAAFAGSTFASPELTRISSYEFGLSNKDGGVAEISAFDPTSKKVFTASAEIGGVVVLDYSNPALPKALDTLRFVSAPGEKRSPNSVAVQNGVLAVAVERVDSIPNSKGVKIPRHLTGDISLFDLTALSGIPLIKSYEVGFLPDMVAFSSDGKKLVVANEGEPSAEYLSDPVGSISVIDLTAGVDKGLITSLDFTKFNADSLKLATAGVILDGFKGATVAQDLEPEYCTISANGTRAWVTLQENNALALIDLTVPAIDSILPLYRKNVSLEGNRMDLIADGKFQLANHPVTALSMPDGITTFAVGGKEYLLIANEGDGRDYGSSYSNETKVSKVTKWATNVDVTQVNALKDLTIHQIASKNSAGEFDKMVMFGARSFAVLDTDGKFVWESGEEFEQITGTLAGLVFNASHAPGAAKLDDRSPKKGPEPESVTTGIINGKPYAFIGLERIGGIMMYDLSNPIKPQFVQYINKRDFTQKTDGTKDALGPEGILFVSAEKSPTAKPLVIVSNEVSGTIETFSFDSPTGISLGNADAKSSLNLQVGINGISLELPTSQVVSVRLFSLNGREISTLHSGDLKAGYHQFALPENLGSGVYLVTVETATEQQARKVSL